MEKILCSNTELILAFEHCGPKNCQTCPLNFEMNNYDWTSKHLNCEAKINREIRERFKASLGPQFSNMSNEQLILQLKHCCIEGEDSSPDAIQQCVDCPCYYKKGISCSDALLDEILRRMNDGTEAK